MNITHDASMHLAQAGFDKVFGARPLRRLIQNEILDELSMQIIEGRISEGDTAVVDYNGRKITIVKSESKQQASPPEDASIERK